MESTPSSTSNAIAIIGMAGRFPGAEDLDGFWENLAAGVESITFFSEQELTAVGIEAELLADPAYVRARSVVYGAEMFDAAFFDVSPREAEVLDPQHRLLLECAWEALERAGYDPRRFPGPISVFAGASINSYMLSNLQHNPDVMRAVGLFQAMVGSCGDFLATRISYKLGLRGPSLTVQTACSTSLVTVHLAVQSLLNSECDMALAGGVRLLVPRKGGHLYQPGGIFSRDGHCRAFDAAATGITEGEGCGLVVLKRLADALADGDHIHAVILGSAINNDGSAKMGYTMPSIEGQAEVIAMAQALAGIDPGTIGFIEAHGTGTPLGDPVEVAALSRVFSTAAEPRHPCALGSLKSNLGHLDTAAGVASLVKATLAIEHNLIPPTLHFERPNPQIDFASEQFYVPVQATQWPGDGPRRAGVSSYGFGGTNAHIVLEEAPEVPPGSVSRPRQLLILSAPTPSALEKITQNLAEHLRRHPEIDLADVAYTLQMGRVPFDNRRIVVCEDMTDAVEVLSALDPKRVLTRARESGNPPVFLFPGQGAQYPGMSADLYRSEPVFREEVDRCAEILHPWLGLDLRQVLYPQGRDLEEAAERLEQTALAQPALFVVEHALARLWMAWGVRPEAMLGHSIGEYVAACLAGVFSLEDALRLVAERGRLMQDMPSGSMLAVSLSETEVRPLLGGLSLAAINGPSMCVVSGDSVEVEDLAARLAGRGLQARRLHTSHAFHSAAMEPMLERFAAAFRGLRLAPPEIPFLSNVTGTWIRPEEAIASRYWVRHLRETVRFSDALEVLFARFSSVFLEIGPGQVLTSLVRQHPKRPAALPVLASLPAAGDGRPANVTVLRTLGQLWMSGFEIDWAGFHSGERRLRVPLPTYPFERQRYWVEAAPGKEQVHGRAANDAKEVADWFWVPLWHQELPPEGSELPDGAVAGTWLVFTDETGLGDRLAARLRECGGEVAIVRAGESFQEAGRGDFVIRPGQEADYSDLLDRLSREGMAPARIVHLWSVVGPVEGVGAIEDAERDQERGFFSLLYLARALGDRHPAEARHPLHLGIVSTGVHRITGAEDLAPARATLLGPATTLPQEYPGVTCAAIDITLLPPGSRGERRLVDLLIAELANSTASPVVAYRGTDRWLRAFKPLSLASSRGPLPLRDAGTYLITGGLGGVGLELAGFLARSARVRLVLASRAFFAEREEWPVLAQGEDRTARIARRLLDLEATGGDVWVAAADVTDAASMRRLFEEARRRFGRFDGVIHAAGLPGGGLMQTRSFTEAEAVLAPKMRGTLVLEELLAGDAPDFLVLCSSLNTLVGGPGQADSAAANAFLDAFAQSRAGELPVFSINWSPWNRQTEERGHGHRSGKTPVLPRIEEMLEGMDPEQAVDAFRRILAGGHLPQIAVSVRSLPEVMERARSMTAEFTAETVSLNPSSGHARPDLKTPYVAPRGEVEEKLAVIWGDVLGLDRIGTADDFFELGGHSLLGTRLVSRVRETFGVEVPLGQLFEAATVAEFAAFVEEKLSLAGASELDGIPRFPRSGELPLSFSQERLWFLDQLEPDSALYNIPYRLWIGGPLVIPALAVALSGLVERHESLRTIFPAENGHPRQVVLPAVPLPLPLVDLQSLPLEVREETALQLAVEESRRPFDLVRGPLLRALLARVEPRRHALILPLHHIIADGWSTGVLLHDLGELYGAAAAGVPSPLPELPVQYADYAVWQRNWLQGEVLTTQLEYWKRQLAGAPAVLELPLDRQRPAEQSYRGASRPVPLSSFLSEAIRRLCRQQGATPFMVLLAAWAVLLGRHAGQDDVLVGAPIAGRNRREVEALIGCFINTLVLRSDLSGNPSFGELLGRVRRTVLDAFAHQDIPFERIVEEVVVERNLAVSPLFQVIFNLHNAPTENPEVEGLVFSQLDVDTGLAKFDLSLILQESSAGFEGSLEHNADLFDGDTVERLLARFAALLEAAVEDPSLPVADLPILLPRERQQVLVEWSGQATSYPRETTIHALFAEQAALSPAAVAVVGAGESLSYAELERRAACWAHLLRALKVGPEVRVGICLDRSPARVVATLAVLMAGGAYVPLDPSYPRERLAFLVRDSGASVLMTEERWLQALPKTEAAVLCLDRDERWKEAFVEIGEAPQVSATGLAYVMYTSGSTGEPKGVAVTHRSVVRLVRETSYAHFGPDEVCLQIAPYAFDASTLELWGALLNGGCLAMPPVGVLSPAELGDLLKRHGVTTLWLTAGLFHQMVDENLQGLAGVRQLLAGGDVLSVPHAQRVLAELPGTQLINGYGPTENTTFTCCYPVADSASLEPSVPLGRPIANTWVYVLDRNLAPVPVGVIGELYTGGDGLARGYLDRPERTAERFLPDPFGREAGGRLYRTGDLTRWGPTGELKYLGRIDAQVKVRGFRVELGEIEVALSAHPRVRQAVVLAEGESGAGPRLVAYVAGEAGEVPETELRGFLRERLPEFMLPAAYVLLSELPLTSNGKVNRKALARLRPERVAATTGEEPRTPAEELLAGIFAEALQVERIGMHESFFEQGGHSLLATRVISRVREAFGVELPLRALFEASTVADLADRVHQTVQSAEGVFLPPIEPVRREGDLPLSFAQARLWFLDQLQPGGSAYNIPAAFLLSGYIDVRVLETAVNEILRRHEALRTTFPAVDGQPVQRISQPSEFCVPVVDVTGLATERRKAVADTLMADELRRMFDLARGPLLRCLLVRLEKREHLLLLNMHHIVSDGWSMGVLVREICTLYPALRAGRTAALAELPIQYPDFAVWQRDWLQGDVLAAQLEYWKRQLAGAPAVLELPLDRPRPAEQSYRGARRHVALFSSLSEAIGRLCRQQGVTPFMALLAAWAVLLGRHAGQDDVLVGAPIAGRNRREIEGLIGFFVNTLVLRSDLSGSPRFGEFLGRVRRTALDAFTHQDLPFERIVEEVVVERNLAVSPLFQVLFALQNAPMEELEVPGLVFSPLDVDTGLAKFDLSLTLQESRAGFVGMLEHNSDLFDGSTVERLLARFAALLEAAVKDPSLPVADLPILLTGERQQALVEWNDTVVDYPGNRCLHEILAAQVRRTPAALALVAGEAGAERLTFATLDAAAERLAARLRILGVGPEVVVALYLERSAALGVAVLAVLKVGGAFLPLDLANPRERLAWVLQDAAPLVVLTVSGLAPRLPTESDDVGGQGPRVVCLDLPAGPEAAAHLTAWQVTPDNLAYVIYTSGSTGRPKGTMIPHRGVVNYLSWAVDAYHVEAGCGAPVHTSLAFDLTLTSLLAPWLAGRCALLVPEAEGVAALGSVLTGPMPAETGFSLVKLTPAHLQLLAEQPGAVAAGRTRALVVGGEALFGESLKAWRSTAPETRVVNEYGPTETVVGCCVYEAPAGVLGNGPVPIGRPIANSRLYVVDDQLRPVPLGTPGELLIGGVGLARGYLRRPELTAERFVPDALGEVQGGRLYCTGDRVRQRPDGILEYLGRLDHQVKIRGFRIEPGEIEAALASHPSVRDCAILMREDAPGSRLLVAYVVLNPKLEIQDPRSNLRSFLSDRLPEYMVPSAIMVLDALPLSPNGKLDRRALPAPQHTHAMDGSYTAPSNPVEELLAGIWGEVLGIERVGVHESFFALGGHSLLATRLVSRLREVFGQELPLRLIFESPTVAALAERVASLREGPSVPPIRPVPRTGDLPLSFAQQRLWFLDRLAPDNPFYNIFGAVRLTGALDVEALRRTFREIVRRHEALRTTFRVVDGHPIQAIAPMLGFEVPLINLHGFLSEQTATERVRAELARLSIEERLRPFNLARGPLVRAYLVRLAPREHTLLLNFHHIISDGWSMGILFRELGALYRAFSEGVPSPLLELPIQYADFAVWQRQWLQGDRLEAELDYWRQQLAGIPEVLELPYDHPRGAIESFRGSTQSFELSAVLVRELTALTRRHGATLSMTMLAGFKALLARYSGQKDIAIGVAIANRTRREIEGLIGFFVNTLVFRSDLADSPGIARLLTRVRETALEAYAHQDLPFERLVAELQPERNLGRNPLIQIMFGYQNFPRSNVEVQGLVLSPPEEGQVPARTAKFDLTLFLVEEGDRLQGILEFNCELFDATTMRRLLEHFENLLAAAVAHPETSVALLPLLTDAESHQLLREWNATGLTSPVAVSLQKLFETQVREDPYAPALLFRENILSYGELNRRANHLAHRLLNLGVGLESSVGVCLERSPELIVALLGILKAGGAYVPLDPEYPRERLAFMVKDSGLQVMVGDELALKQLPDHLIAAVDVVLLGVDSECVGDVDDDPPVMTSGDNLAYVMYTSGSTGRPKGVAVPHRAVARLVRDTDYIQLGSEQVFLQFAPISFDASTLEIWGALLNGARLVLPPPHALSLEELGPAIELYGVTTLWLTAGLFHQFVDQHLEVLRPVRQLLAGGDVLSVAHVRRVLAELPDTRLINGYGPTENTTFTCCHPMQGPQLLESSVPIGHAIAHTTVHLLDPHGRPVPIGVVGELWTGGDGLARGYLGRPGLTAERFLPDPFAGESGREPGSRLYRTGDLARRLADGSIEFLGRMDQQVKVRGFRIEPAEVESRLGEHPAVLQSVVLAREDVPGDRRLVAYVVQNPAYEVLESGAQTEQVSHWSDLFDDTYRQGAAGAEPTFNIIGWNSSYTDLPLLRAEMEDWLDDAVERIAALGPKRVLEIGCGTGLILFRIAPRCELYVGTDISGQGLDYIERQLGHSERLGIDRSRVRLLRRSAEQLDGLEPGTFDTVILNSVVQYFPSAGYLSEVIKRALERVRPGGSIFLGDLRSLPLLEAFHTSVELFQATPETPLARLRQKVQARRLQENELVVSPAFFADLARRLPRIGRVEVHPKHGGARNELTGFRYQVVLRVCDPGEKGETVPWLDWRVEELTVESLRRRLEQERPGILGLRNVPNARVSEAAAAARLLRWPGGGTEEGIETAGDLRRRATEAAAGAVEPQDLWDLGAELSYEVELSWASHGADGSFEAVLWWRDGGSGETGRPAALSALLPLPQPPEGPSGQLANNPLQGRFARRIAPELRAFLGDRLPDYMVPSSFVLLDALPLTPNEKVDRRQLPAPDFVGLEAGRAFVAPRNPTEERLLEIWRELLRGERIGVEDDFFALGGHSLLATQAVSRVRKELGVELPLRTFFESPTVAALAREVDALLRAGGETETPPIVPIRREGPLPLSFAQERLWFLHLLDRRVLAYNESSAFRLDGRLDEAAFRWSLDEVVRRHESLRTVFPEVDGWAVQRILPPTSLDLPSIDLRGLPASAREEEAARLALEQARHPFDLMRGPLARGLLIRLDETDHAVVFFFHHIVFDGWSTAIFVRELSALYRTRTAGEPSPLPPLPIQYGDFAVWQRQWLQWEVLERQLGYWRERLTGVAVLNLPTDRPRRARPAAAGDWRPVVVAPDLTRRLRELSQRQGATLFMTVLAAFQVLLHRTAGQEDVAVGTPIANRNRGELEDLIGFFVNMLVLRTDLSGSPTFAEMVGRVREIALGAYAHQDLPFEKLVAELQPDRDLLHNPLFQVGFQLLNLPATQLEMPGLALSPLPFETRFAKFDLNLSLIEEAERISGLIDYDSGLFDAPTVVRTLHHFQAVLAAVAVDPTVVLSEILLLSPWERHQVLAEWGGAGREPSARTLHGQFAEQARRTPEAPAVSFAGEALSYGELARRANQLARRLREFGVGPESRVALCLERSLDLVVGILGILEAGGAYVPLDPGYPRERLAFMVEDSGACVVVGSLESVGVLPDMPHTVLLDAHREALAALPAGHLEPLGDGASLAYVIYTSGSTGHPKGALVTHGNAVRLFDATSAWFGFGERDVWTLFHSYAFDFSVWEIWGALLYGGRVVVVPYEVSRSPGLFLDLLTREGVTVLNQTPSAFNELAKVDEERGGVATDLRLVIFGGEALDLPGLAPWFERHGDARPRLVNMYGITETTVHVTYRPLRAVDARGERRSAIGVPIPDLSLHVLDPWLRPAPVGVPGELVVGGAGLARGYLNRPELTAERFVPDPFSDRPGTRLYRSGDLSRFLASGDLEYLGRIDHQVKIRGFRIELGEIQAALEEHPAVRQAVVLPKEEPGGERRLVAFFVAQRGSEPSVGELRAMLARRLPDYMVPAGFLIVEDLPLTRNGKVDRKALLSMAGVGRDEMIAYESPRNQIQQVLVEVWQEVLGVGRIGIDDRFFSLGGDSILSIRVCALVQQRGLSLSLDQIFEHQTVRELSEQLWGEAGRMDEPAPTEPFELLSEQDRLALPDGLEDAYPLAALQTGMLFHSGYTAKSTLYQNVTSLRLEAPFDGEALREAIRQLLARHPVLRTSFDTSRFSESLQLVHSRVEPPLEVEDLRGLLPEDRERRVSEVIEEERHQKLDEAVPPLLRFRVHLLEEGVFQFTWTEHHAILDGWSVATLTAELFRLYRELRLGRPSPPPPASLVSFRDFVALERRSLSSDGERSFWLRKLEEAPRLRLPRRSGWQEGQEPRMRSLEIPLEARLPERLQRFASSLGVPLKNVLLAAHYRVLGATTGQADLVSGLVVNGRPEVEGGDRILGLFLNTVPLRLRLAGGTWTELVRQTFEAEQELSPFRRYPMADLQHRLGSGALFETAFNYVHFHVLQGLGSDDEVRVLANTVHAETNLPFNISFLLAGPLLSLEVEYDETLFDAAQAEAISARYPLALELITAHPGERYDARPLLSDPERHQLLHEWNDTHDLCSDRPIHELFDLRAIAAPEAMAVVGGEISLTYGELRAKAWRLAGRLRSFGVGPEVRVGLLLDRSADLIVGLLGILQAGGVCLPLDPENPETRLRHILEDSRTSILVTRSDLARSLPSPGHSTVLIDSDDEELWPSAEAGRSGDLAYVIYTSGSTGVPKGVLVGHGPLANAIGFSVRRYGLMPSDRVLQFASISFDASLEEIFSALVSGATVVLRDDAMLESPRHLLEAAIDLGITMLSLPTAYWHKIVAALAVGEARWPSSIRLVAIGGERAHAESLARWLALGLDTVELINVYGPTEATIGCTHATLHGLGAAPESGEVPIGRPYANARVYLLGSDLQLVPPGAIGELYVGGDVLARGYFGLPALTAWNFVPDPFHETPGARMYRTGDLAVHRLDGLLEFRGRVDTQVKVRGFRIEPGEIEAALSRHSGVREAVVVALEYEEETVLAGYVVPGEPRPTAGELHRFLREQIPAYMIPPTLVLLDQLTLTVNGKVDTAALPVPEHTQRPERDSLAPRDTLELQLVRLWEDLLGIRPIGVREDFFELGGHSLVAVQLVARLQKSLGVSLTMATLLRNSTIENLAAALRGGEPARSLLVELAPGEGRPFLCIHAIGGEVFGYIHLARSLTGHQIYGLQAAEPEISEATLEEMAARYLLCLRAVQPVGPYSLGGWSMGGVIAFEMARQLEQQGEVVDLLVLIDSFAPDKERRPPQTVTDSDMVALFANDLARLFGIGFLDLPPSFGDLTAGEALAWLSAEAQRSGLLPPGLEGSEWERRFAIFRANFRALERYAGGSCAAPALLFKAATPPAATNHSEPDSGWGRLLTRPIEVHDLPGDHYTLLQRPLVENIAALLRDRLYTPQLRRNKEEGSALVALAAGLRMAGSEKSAMIQGTAMKTSGS